MYFTPRLVQILFILIKSDKAITTEELATHLQISKRTLFREIKDVNRQLAEYDIILNNQMRKGIILEGLKENKKRLLDELEISDSFDPRNKETRQRKLIKALIRENETQKIFSYANKLQVSEATISNDLEEVKPWFSKFNITIVKRSGFGIELAYDEINYRKMMLEYIIKFKDESILEKDTIEIVKKILSQITSQFIDGLTPNSMESIIFFLGVMIDRVRTGQALQVESSKTYLENNSKLEVSDNVYNLVSYISKEVEMEFDIEINDNEAYNTYLFFKSCPCQNYINLYDGMEDLGLGITLKEIVFEMLTVFDSKIAFELRMDDDFINGMMSHLRPTITRLVHNIAIHNPLLEEIKEGYEEFYEKALEASDILGNSIGCIVPEEEVGFIAVHLGAALVRLEDRQHKKRRVDIGVICASGIGIARLLSSRLSQYFDKRVKMKILTIKDLKKQEELDVDFIISTFELELNYVEGVQVSAMLSKDDLEKIDTLVNKYSIKDKKVAVEQVHSGELYQIIENTKEIESILNSFKFYYINHKSTFSDIVYFAAEKLGKTEDDKEEIIEGIMKRESLSTQIIPEYEVGLLHCRTDVVDASKIIIILPEDGIFLDEYLCNSRAIVIILIKNDDKRETPAVSSISKLIFEDEDFLEFIKKGEKEIVRDNIEKTLDDFLQESVKHIYE